MSQNLITTAIARPPLTPTHHEKKGLDAISALTDSHRDQSDMDDSDEHTLTAFGDISPSNRYFIPLSTYSEISPSKRIARRLKAGRPAFPRKTATGKIQRYQPYLTPIKSRETNLTAKSSRYLGQSLKLYHSRKSTSQLAPPVLDHSGQNRDTDVCCKPLKGGTIRSLELDGQNAGSKSISPA